jgi:hypothetical protein
VALTLWAATGSVIVGVTMYETEFNKGVRIGCVVTSQPAFVVVGRSPTPDSPALHLVSWTLR